MDRTPIIASGIAAVAGIVVAIALTLVGGNALSQTHPTTNLSSFDAKDGFLQGTQDYGSRDNTGADK
ncbi:DUF2613 family protein [Tsukamurella sp. 8F]|uniref:DUF2613 family protein n=1 Tax=unclassified Tsukamurella TaxID=2633480 RepID=UPI0023B97C63|nr:MULTISPECIES: DUF2613 family protein [unclassified Tsukamurella]MDF0529880.1 DUF2613 family protein [Tsukamurella sp. 8J]MDF0588665.1 DUF2613 family protein [Tsukamurella sp. 8F]